MTGGNKVGGSISHDAAMAAIAAVAGRATGPVGLAARHLESGETLDWHASERFSTASMIKVAIHAAVLRRAGLGAFGLDDEVELKESDHVGGSGVLGLLRPGLRCTVSDLCTLMIVVSDNTATNMLIDLCGGAGAVNDDFAALGFPGFQLNRRITMQPGGPLATVTLEIITVLRHQQHQAQFPRAYLGIADPGDPPGPDGPAMAHKTGSTSGCRTEAGLLYPPDGGGTVAYAVAADRLADRTMTALAEGDEILGLLGAIVLARWWPGPGPVPVRDGWLP